MEKNKSKKSSAKSLKKVDLKNRISKNKVTKKINDNIKKATVKKQEVKKQEKWYVWLKNNILENESKYSKESKLRRTFITIFAVFCFFVVAFSTSVIDYTRAVKNDTEPFFVLKVQDKYKQATIYYGFFYKAWKCNNDNTDVIFGRYSTEIGYCTLVANFDENGVYTNPNGVKISASEMNTIKKFYFDEFVNIKSKEELQEALKISNAINEIWWVIKDSEVILNNDASIKIAIFNKLVEVDGIQSWEPQYNDVNYQKCAKKVNDSYAFSNYTGTGCNGEWKEIILDNDICSLAKENTKFVGELVTISELCK